MGSKEQSASKTLKRSATDPSEDTVAKSASAISLEQNGSSLPNDKDDSSFKGNVTALDANKKKKKKKHKNKKD